MAAPTAFVVRYALARCRAFTRLFALLEVQTFPWRARHILLTGARVALGIGTGLPPYMFHACRVCECRLVLDTRICFGVHTQTFANLLLVISSPAHSHRPSGAVVEVEGEVEVVTEAVLKRNAVAFLVDFVVVHGVL